MNKEKELQTAGKLAPELKHWTHPAQAVVDLKPSAGAWQHIGVAKVCPAEMLPDQILRKDSKIILDFGETLVGKVRLRLDSWRSIDSPVRLELLAAELPYEASQDPETYKSTGLGCGWLQQDLVTSYELPDEIEIPYRWSLRYLVIRVTACPSCGVKIAGAEVIAQSAAGEALPPPLPGFDRELTLIDRTASRTLRNCLQDFPEDGPKRDRRLWLGDLRLQALVNHVTFRRYDQIERGIRLLAACRNEQGMIPAAIMMKPEIHASSFILDYALLFPVLLLEHCRFSCNLKPGKELFDAAAHQLSFFRAGLDETGNFHDPGECWIFIDHCVIDRTTALSCVAIRSAESLAELAELLKHPAKQIRTLKKEAAAWRKALRETAFDPAEGLLRSGSAGQISWASQIWGVLAGVLTPEEGRTALSKLKSLPSAIAPQTPYLMHYFLEACRSCGMEELLQYTIRQYWGGMIRRGADTFWEVYREGDDFFTPYGNEVRSNSACHAWSGTPGYFLRTPAGEDGLRSKA